MKTLAHPTCKVYVALLALAAIWAVPALAQDSPNLSGIWKWNPDKSHVGGRPVMNRRVKIEQQGSDLTITTRVLSELGETFQKTKYTVGSDDNSNQMMGSTYKSKVEWKDGALSIESVGHNDDGEVKISETWTPSADGQTLMYHATRVAGDRPPREDTIAYEKQPEADWEAPMPPKPAEEAFKNIQVLKGMPATQLMTVMQHFAQGLGTHCTFCHVQGAFDKDDKPEKATARKMILMARQINADNFGGHMRVTCWTCHRGATEPESAPK